MTGATQGGGNATGPTATSAETEDTGLVGEELPCLDASGSRLRHVFVELPNGARDHVRLIDTQLDTECAFQLAEDSALRCLPTDTAPTMRQLFTDAACQFPILELQPKELLSSGVQPRFARTPDSAECSVPLQIFEVGEELERATVTVFVLRQGSCVPTPTSTVFDYHAAKTVFAADDFVRGTELWTGAGRIPSLQINGSDGSVVCERGLRDTNLPDQRCSLARAEDGELRCLPQHVSSIATWYRDPTCREDSLGTVAVQSGCSKGSAFARDRLECDRVRVYEVGAPAVGLYRTDQGTCRGPSPSSFSYHELGVTTPPTSFARFHLDPVPTHDHLERVDYVDDDGLRLHHGLWRDPALDAYCMFMTAADERLRCLPISLPEQPQAAMEVFYFDAACTNAIELGWRRPGCDTDMPTYATGRGRTYPVTGTRAGEFYFMGDEGCRLPSEPLEYFELGPEIPLEQLIEAVERQE